MSIAVMFYSGVIQKASQMMTLPSVLSDKGDVKH